MAAMLDGMVDKVVQIVTNDGRNIVGMLKGFDQTTNVILDECHERVFSPDAGVEQARGDGGRVGGGGKDGMTQPTFTSSRAATFRTTSSTGSRSISSAVWSAWTRIWAKC